MKRVLLTLLAIAVLLVIGLDSAWLMGGLPR